MPVKSKIGNEWGFEGVKAQLQKKAAANGTASAQVFFQERVGADDLGLAIMQAIRNVTSRRSSQSDIAIGRINRLSKSVAVRGDVDTIADLLNEQNVKAVLPSEIDDIYPKPVG